MISLNHLRGELKAKMIEKRMASTFANVYKLPHEYWNQVLEMMNEAADLRAEMRKALDIKYGI
jgi:hypothetical protein